MPAKVSQQADHDAEEVGQLLSDIRDTLLPQINPDCTFTSRRHDKRLQERLIEVSEQHDPDFTNLVYSADLDGTAHGWGDVKPYAKYVERPRPGKPDQAQKRRNTLPVDSSTIVRHLQERIQKWASRKSDRSYGSRTYRAVMPGAVENKKDTIKVPLINSVDLSSSSSREARDEGKEVGKNGKKTDKAKLDVNWNILSTNDAALLNMSTYGMDPSCTYVPARRSGSSSAPMDNYTASKQFITDSSKQKKSRGVLHPRQRSHVVKRLPKCKEVTIDLPEDPEETKLVMTPNTRKAVSTQKKKSFKCSICIEGLQVAGFTCSNHSFRHELTDYKKLDWPTDFEYYPSEPRIPKIGPFVGRNAAVSESLQDYKRLKSREGSVSETEAVTVPFPVLVVPEAIASKVSYTMPTAAPPPDQATSLAKASYQKLNTKIVVKNDRVVKRSADRPRRGKPSLHTGPTGNTSKRNVTKNEQLKADHTSIMLNGTCTLETSSKILKRLSDCDRDESPPKSPLSLFDRFQASRSRDGAHAAAEKHQPKISVKLNKKGTDKRERKMLGVSICDIFTRPTSPEAPEDLNQGKRTELIGAPHDPGLGDVFDYEILFDSGELDLTKPKLDPIMNIRPLYIN